jgi:signal transduction histidine kinase
MEQQIHCDARILIVDDQEHNVRLLEEILREACYINLASSTDARQVHSLVKRFRPHLILLDLTMPHLDGFQVMEQLKPAMPEAGYVPILVLTADMSQEGKRRALRAGAADFLTKPFDAVEVLLRIENLLTTHFLQLESQHQNRLLEQKVRERTEELSRMFQQVVTAQEKERRRLTMEVHDGPLQSLSVCTMVLDRVIRRHENDQKALVQAGLRELRDGLTNAIAEVRGVLADLSPDVLSNYGLAPALRDYVGRFSGATGIGVNVSIAPTLDCMLRPDVELLVYRVAQEALSNVRKHARASRVEMALCLVDDELYMEISDDGVGFDIAAVLQPQHAGEHLGLRSMRERIENAHGQLLVASEPGTGTRLEVRLPLNTLAHDGQPGTNSDSSE